MKKDRRILLSHSDFSLIKKYLQARLASDLTVRDYLGVIKKLFEWRKKVTHSKQNKECVITMTDIEEFLGREKRHKAKAAIIYLLKYKDVGYEAINSLPKIKEQEPKDRVIPTYKEFMAVINELDDEENMIAQFLLFTGARCYEIFSVKYSDIKPDGSIAMETKGRKSRTVKIPKMFLKKLEHYLDQEKEITGGELAFYTYNIGASDQTKRKMFWKKLNATSQRVIGKAIATHDFRRFYATFLYEKTGRDIMLVKRLMGHKRIETTYKYVQYADKDKDIDKAARALSELKSS